jgi:hypothetical protein
MSSELGSGPWERVALELRACKETQQKAWGDIDNATLGRYLAGDASAQERATVEQALDELPELRKLTDLVRDVLDDLEPVAAEPPGRPAVLAFPQEPGSKWGKVATFLRRRSSLIAAACLLLTFGLAMPRPGFLSAPVEEAPRVTGAVASRGFPFVPAAAPALPGGRPEAALPAVPRPEAPGNQFLALASKVDPSLAPQGNNRRAAELNRRAVLYSSRGELARAVPPLQQAHQICQARLGPDHPATRNTARHLAGVYQAALNAPDTLSASPTPPLPEAAPPQPSAPVNPYAPPPRFVGRGRVMLAKSAESYFRSATALRDQISARSTQEVQAAVVPVLTRALEVSSNPQERLKLVRAIAALGPAASNAVPVLTERLKNSSDPAEVRIVLKALSEIGPAARDALPALEALSGECQGKDTRAVCATKTGAKEGRKGPRRHFSPHDAVHVRKVLACLNGPQGRAGIADRAGCFTVKAVRHANRAIRHLAQDARVEVLFETVCTADAVCRDGAKRLPGEKLSPDKRFVHVVFDREGRSVQVSVSTSLEREGVTPDKVRERLLPCLRRHQYDKALDAGVRFVAEVTAKK